MVTSVVRPIKSVLFNREPFYSPPMQNSVASPLARRSVGDQARALLVLGLPLVGSHLLQMAIGVTDTVMLGWYDVTALAAQSVSGPLFFIIFIFGSGFGFAVAPMVAKAASQEDDRQIRRVTRMGLWWSIIFSVLVTPIFFFIEPIFLAIGQDAEVARLAGQYMPYMGLGLMPALLVQVLKNYLTALELTRSILIAAAVAVVFNAAINYVLIFGALGMPEMGIAGAGIASAASHVLTLVLLAGYAVRRRPDHSLFRNFQRRDPEALRAVFVVGFPIGVTLLAETGLFAAAGVMMGWLGPIPLAAHGIALSLASMTFMVPLGLSQALTVRIGRAQGDGDAYALRNAAYAGLMLASIAAIATVAAFLLLPEFLVGLYVDPNDPARPDILIIGSALLAVAALFQLVDFGQVMALGMLRGVQDTTVPMVMAAVSYWCVGLPVAYLMAFDAGFEGTGVWLGLTCGLLCACVMLQYRFWTLFGHAKMPHA